MFLLNVQMIFSVVMLELFRVELLPMCLCSWDLHREASLTWHVFPKYFFCLSVLFSKELYQKSIHFQNVYFTFPVTVDKKWQHC